MAFPTRAAAAAVLMLRLSLCLSSGAAAPAAGGESTRVERRLASMGTMLAVSVAGPDRGAALASSEKAVREIGRVEERLTTWRKGGPLDRVNRARPGEAVALDPEISGLLAAVFDWSERTEGAFDPTVAPLVRAWDLRGGGRVPGAVTLARARAATGRDRFRLDAATGEARRLCPGAGIDEGAWGKGYALDRAVEALRRAGVRDAVLDLGGQVSAIGRAAVAVADPRERGRATFTLVLADASVSTSGNSERRRFVEGRPIGHLLDPRTGYPAPDFGSATVVAPSGLTADILSTAFFVLGPEKGLALSESLRRRGFENRALFLVVTEGRLNAVASPGLEFHREGE